VAADKDEKEEFRLGGCGESKIYIVCFLNASTVIHKFGAVIEWTYLRNSIHLASVFTD
jgi:hypothetical protein